MFLVIHIILLLAPQNINAEDICVSWRKDTNFILLKFDKFISKKNYIGLIYLLKILQKLKLISLKYLDYPETRKF